MLTRIFIHHNSQISHSAIASLPEATPRLVFAMAKRAIGAIAISLACALGTSIPGLAGESKQTTNFGSFTEWCLHKDSISEDEKHTVEVLLQEADTSNCEEANKVLSNLVSLDINDKSIKDVSPLSQLTNLTKLNIYNNQISDISPLSQLINLTELDISNNQISDISPLANLTNLTELGLSLNQIREISPLSELTNLTKLYLAVNQVSNLSPLSQLINLTELSLYTNEISDISPLSQLINLVNLDLFYNRISDISPLSSLEKLLNIRIKNNPIIQKICPINPQRICQFDDEDGNELYQEANDQFQQGEFRQSLETFQQVLDIYTKSNYRLRIGDTLNGMGDVRSNLGEYAQALESYQKSLAIRQLSGDTVGEIITLSSLGSVYERLGKYQEALESLQEAYAKLNEYKKVLQSTYIYSYDTRIQDTESLLVGIAIVQDKLGNYSESLRFAKLALASYRISNDDYREGVALDRIGVAYFRVNNTEKALMYLEKALATMKKSGDKAGEGRSLNNIGDVYFKLGKTEKALALYQEALVLSQTVADKAGEAATLNNIGFLLEQTNQPELAIVFYKQSVNVTEAIRQNIQKLSKEIQQSYIETVAKNYRNLANLLLKQDRILEAQQVLDLLKVQELDDYLRNVRGNEQTQQGIDYLPQEKQLLEQYNTKLIQVVQLGKELEQIKTIPPENRTPQQEKRRQEIATAQRQLLREYLDFINSPEIATLSQQLNQTTGGENLNPKTLIKLQDDLKKLGQDAVILYPLILDDRLELVLVTSYAPPIRRPVAIKKEELNRAIAEFRSALTQPNKRISLKPAQTTGKQLYDWLIKPIESALTEANAKTIIYAPDGQLRYIPLAALYDGNQWLIQKYRINNITALSLTDLDKKDQNLKILAGAFTQGNYSFQIGEESFSFSGLSFAKKEVETIANTIPNTTQIIDAKFSESETLAQMSNYSILHFATHAAFVTGQPEESFILFGNGDRANFRDVETWALTNVDLVVLSACETGLGGKLGDGREILGFGYLMQQAGAKAAMASLWGVDDGGTQVLMNGFYRALTSKNTTKAEALRQAQIALITGDYSGLGEERGLGVVPRDDNSSPSKAEFSHPYYWASFILIGNGL